MTGWRTASPLGGEEARAWMGVTEKQNQNKKISRPKDFHEQDEDARLASVRWH